MFTILIVGTALQVYTYFKILPIARLKYVQFTSIICQQICGEKNLIGKIALTKCGQEKKISGAETEIHPKPGFFQRSVSPEPHNMNGMLLRAGKGTKLMV